MSRTTLAENAKTRFEEAVAGEPGMDESADVSAAREASQNR